MSSAGFEIRSEDVPRCPHCGWQLGVGEMTPGIITLPFWSMTAKLPDAHLLSVNISGDSAPLQLDSKAEAIQADLGALLSVART